MTNWNTLVAIHGPAVWGVCSRLLGNHRADAEECYQETWMSAWKASQGRTIAFWPSFLCRIATSKALDRLRHRYRQKTYFGLSRSSPTGEVSDVIGTAVTPVESAVVAELSDRLRVALAELPARQSEVFSLHVLSDWSQQEIATQLKMSVNAVGVTIHRARQKLRQLLDESN